MSDVTHGGDAGGGDRPRPTNERLLCTAFVSFATLGVAQTVGALLAGSEALLADAAAMLVDALTYLFNWYAERRKDRYAAALGRPAGGDGANDDAGGGDDAPHDDARAALLLRKYTLQLEIVPPLVSVTTLLIVTGFTLRDAVGVLILDTGRDASEQGEPDVNVMMAFSVLNIFLDGLNVTCFARAHHALGYSTAIQEEGVADEADAADGGDGGEGAGPVGGREPFTSEPPAGGERRANLNMCSAYTHVFADSLRTTAMILASVLAKVVPAITPEVADASAAVVVSVFIILSLVPLVTGMVQSVRALRRVNARVAATMAGAPGVALVEETTPGATGDEGGRAGGEGQGDWA